VVNLERMVVELTDILFKILYDWMVVINSSRFAKFEEFLDLFIFPYLNRRFFCLLICLGGCASMRKIV
jgi:hypothetical protein